jgi:hypothetical protein
MREATQAKRVAHRVQSDGSRRPGGSVVFLILFESQRARDDLGLFPHRTVAVRPKVSDPTFSPARAASG